MKPLHPAFLDREYFENLSHFLIQLRKPKEHLILNLFAEASHFVRINGAKIRQNGSVEDALLEVTLTYESSPGNFHKCSHSLTLCGLAYDDQNRIRTTLDALRTEVVQLPVDPYAQILTDSQTSTVESQGTLLSQNDDFTQMIEPLKKADFAGIYASGPMVRALASSSGQKHWFYTERFSLDYSLYTRSQRALKGTFAGNNWNTEEYQKEIQSAQDKLTILEKSPIQLSRGSYRCYLAPAATSDLVHMLSWGCMSEASIQQGDSPLRKVRQGEKSFSPLFSLHEDFRGGETPRFNEEGELAPESLPLIEKGKLLHSLISSRTAKEYKLTSNFADDAEALRAPALSCGNLNETHVLDALGTGLYLSNLHYLNWSDQPGGRITGMTRYACFWVENGKIVAPIENMRFDDSLFNLFGDSLEDLTSTRVYVPDVGSYSMRNTGGAWVPGILVSKMNFTL